MLVRAETVVEHGTGEAPPASVLDREHARALAVAPVLEVEPKDLHERTPVFMGNRDLGEKAEECIKRVITAYSIHYTKLYEAF